MFIGSPVFFLWPHLLLPSPCWTGVGKVNQQEMKQDFPKLPKIRGDQVCRTCTFIFFNHFWSLKVSKYWRSKNQEAFGLGLRFILASRHNESHPESKYRSWSDQWPFSIEVVAVIQTAEGPKVTVMTMMKKVPGLLNKLEMFQTVIYMIVIIMKNSSRWFWFKNQVTAATLPDGGK